MTSIDADRLEVYDLATLAPVTTVPVGASPHGIVVDQRRRTVLAAVTGTDQVAVLDARRGTVLDHIDVAAGPAGMTIDPGTGRVFVGNQGAGVVTTLTPTR